MMSIAVKARDPEYRVSISKALTGVTKSSSHREALRDSYRKRSFLLLYGRAATLNEISQVLSVDRKTIRDRAKRYDVPLQEAVDFYAVLKSAN